MSSLLLYPPHTQKNEKASYDNFHAPPNQSLDLALIV